MLSAVRYHLWADFHIIRKISFANTSRIFDEPLMCVVEHFLILVSIRYRTANLTPL